MLQPRWSKLLQGTTLALAAAGLASATYQALGQARDRRGDPAPGRLVDIGGYRLHLWRKGEGNPPVVVVPALGATALEWARVQDALADRTSVYLYDRAGLGWSDPGPWPRSTGRMADELHRLLQAAGVSPPYVLVGHSLGGHVARLYAARHPEKLAGMVLVDASHEDMDRRMAPIVGKEYGPLGRWKAALDAYLRPLGVLRLADQLGLSTKLRLKAEGESPQAWREQCLAHQLDSKQRRAGVGELVACDRSAAEVRAEAGQLRDLPLHVLSAGFKGRESFEPVWPQLQAELAALSHCSEQTFAAHTGHHANLDDPDLVAKTIRGFLDRLAGDSTPSSDTLNVTSRGAKLD